MTAVTVRTSGTQVIGETYVGTTHTTIQNAVNYVASTGGGTVFIESGTYTCSTPVSLASNIEIAGEGDATVLKSGSSGSLTTSNKINVFIHDIKVDGAASTSTASYGMTFTGVGSGPDNVESTNDAALIGPGVTTDYGFRVENCTIVGHSGYGIYVENCYHSEIARNVFDADKVHAVYTNGLRASRIAENFLMGGAQGIYATNMEEVQIYGNLFQHLSQASYPAIYLSAPDRVAVSGNVFRNCSGYGVRVVTGSQCSITGNIIVNNGGYSIIISGTCEANTISGNVLVANRYYLYLSGTANRGTTIAANIVVHNGSIGVYNTSSTNNTFVGNICARNGSTDLYLYSSNYSWVGGNVCERQSATGTGIYTQYNVDI